MRKAPSHNALTGAHWTTKIVEAPTRPDYVGIITKHQTWRELVEYMRTLWPDGVTEVLVEFVLGVDKRSGT